MAAQSSGDMLLKPDQTGSGSFLTVAGLRTRALVFNAASVDTTDQESAGRWRELGAGCSRTMPRTRRSAACSLLAPFATGN